MVLEYKHSSEKGHLMQNFKDAVSQFKFGHMPFIANSSCSKHDGQLPTSIPFLSQFTKETAFL